MIKRRGTIPWIFLAVCLLLPPMAIALVWVRFGWKTPFKLGITAVLVIFSWIYVVHGLGLKIERGGNGWRPLVSVTPLWVRYGTLASTSGVTRRSVAEASSLKSFPHLPAVLYGWTGFRGAARDGRYLGGDILTVWPRDGLPLLWSRSIGGGYASFAASQQVAFTIEQRRSQEVVVAYNLESGSEVWTHAWDAEFQESMGGDGPRATPVWCDGLLYALGATGEFRCFEAATGEVRWGLNILADNDAENLQWGMSSSPLIKDEQVILLPGGPLNRSVVSYHRLTGQFLWGSLSDKQAYAAPIQAELAGKDQVLVVTASRVVGLAPKDGALLWEYPWQTSYDVNSVEPLVLGSNRFFISSGYGHGAAVVEIVPSGEDFVARTVWTNNRMKNKFNGSVLHENHVYGLDEGILACMDIVTGERKWKRGRYGYGQVLLASGHLVVLTETGDLVLVEANPKEHRELARFSALTGKTWNYPIIVGGRLLVRNTSQMACFDIRPL